MKTSGREQNKGRGSRHAPKILRQSAKTAEVKLRGDSAVNRGVPAVQAHEEEFASVSKAELRSGGLRWQTSFGDITESIDSL